MCDRDFCGIEQTLSNHFVRRAGYTGTLQAVRMAWGRLRRPARAPFIDADAAPLLSHQMPDRAFGPTLQVVLVHHSAWHDWRGPQDLVHCSSRTALRFHRGLTPLTCHDGLKLGNVWALLHLVLLG